VLSRRDVTLARGGKHTRRAYVADLPSAAMQYFLLLFMFHRNTTGTRPAQRSRRHGHVHGARPILILLYT